MTAIFKNHVSATVTPPVVPTLSTEPATFEVMFDDMETTELFTAESTESSTVRDVKIKLKSTRLQLKIILDIVKCGDNNFYNNNVNNNHY